MSYTSFVFFIAYFGITYLLYTVVPKKAKWCVLLVGSWAFYLVATKGRFEYLAATTLMVWGMGLVIQKLNDKFKEKKKDLEKAERKKLKEHYKRLKGLALAGGVAVSMGLLIFLKYFNFFGGAANHFFGTEIPKLNLVHPMGISFYTLQAVSYLTDVYRGRFKAEKIRCESLFIFRLCSRLLKALLQDGISSALSSIKAPISILKICISVCSSLFGDFSKRLLLQTERQSL